MAIKTVATNRKAYHNYHIDDSVEAGIVLTGTEIKSIRAGRVNLGDAYVRAEGRELWLVNAKPIYIGVFIVTGSGVPSCVHVVPSAE